MAAECFGISWSQESQRGSIAIELRQHIVFGIAGAAENLTAL